MNFNTDGFNERTNYIHNSNNIRNNPNSFDNSFAKMRAAERRDLVTTVNQDEKIVVEEARGDKDNFLIRNNNMNRINTKSNLNNPVSNALNRNMFKR